MSVLHFVGHWTGISDEAGAGYGFWSGIGLTIFLPLSSWRRHNCHTHRCWRIGRIETNGHLLCPKCAGKPRHTLRLPHVHLTHR